VKAALIAVAANIVLKILLMGPLAQVGLALATTIGGWVNFGLVVWFAVRAGLMTHDAGLARSIAKLALAGLVLAIALMLGEGPAQRLFAGWRSLHEVATLATLIGLGALVYGGAVAVLFGRQWLVAFRRNPATVPPIPLGD